MESKKDYCIGFFEELYWSLDSIEEEDTRNKIKDYFNQNFAGANQLEFELLYDSKTRQFIYNRKDIEINKYLKVNYPNFEIIILDAYINLFTQGKNYCPAFWYNCEEKSLNNFFEAAKDFSKIWIGENDVLKFLENNLPKHRCSSFLRTSINQKDFISDLNILIKELTN